MNIIFNFTEKPNGIIFENIEELWQSCFGDEPSFIRSILRLPEYVGVVYAAVDGEVVGMAHLLSLDSYKKAYYVYAVATAEEYRGQGIARGIMEYLCKKACNDGAILLLHPANGELAEAYGRMGFKPFSYTYTVECQGDGGAYRFISPSEYKQYREVFLGGMDFFGWSTDAMTASGCAFIAFEINGDGCAACINNGKVLEVCAPFDIEGVAVRRAACGAGEKPEILMFSESPVGAECAVMSYNYCGTGGYFNLFLD